MDTDKANSFPAAAKRRNGAVRPMAKQAGENARRRFPAMPPKGNKPAIGKTIVFLYSNY
jgi:hypothetical protein